MLAARAWAGALLATQGHAADAAAGEAVGEGMTKSKLALTAQQTSKSK